MSVWLGDLDGRPRYEHDALAPHYAASTMKLPLVIAAFRRVVRGELDLDTPVRVSGTFASVHDGSPFDLDESDDQDPPTWAAVGDTRTLARARRAGHHPLEQHRDQPADRRRRPRRGRGGAPHRRLLAGDGRRTRHRGRGRPHGGHHEHRDRCRPRARHGRRRAPRAGPRRRPRAGPRRGDAGPPGARRPGARRACRRARRRRASRAGSPASRTTWRWCVPRARSRSSSRSARPIDLDETEAAAFVAGIARDVWRAEHPAEEEQP